jgi:putative peptidoglycan lipid II flippase
MALLAVGTITGQTFGLLRSLFVASAVGISSAFDAVLVAMVVPTVLAYWLTNATRVALVPAYMHIAHRSGEPEARRFLGGLLTYTALATGVAVVLVATFPAPSVAIAGPGLPPEARGLALGYVPILAPMLGFLAMSNLMIAVCQIGKTYVPVALASTLGPLAALVVTMLLWDQFGVTAFALGTTVNAAVTLLVLAGGALQRGLLPRPSLRIDRGELSSFARHALPMVVGSGVLQLNLISDRAIATLLSTGAVSALKFGQQIVSEPAAALSISWATVVYPAVVEASGPRSTTRMGAAMTIAVRYTLAIFVPITVATIALAPLVVSVVYGRGRFDSEAVRTTVTVVAAFAPMILLTMIQPVLTAAHNARRRGALMAATGIANAVLNVVLNVVFGSVLGPAGIALSSSVTLALLIVFLIGRVPRDEAFQVRELVDAGGRALAASLIAGIPIAVFVWRLAGDTPTSTGLAILIFCSIAGGFGYVVLTRLFGLPEPMIVIGALGRRIRGRVRRS